jgi:hypothetical protein
MSQELLAKARAAIAKYDPTAVVELHGSHLKVDSVLAAPALVGILRASSILTQDANPHRHGYSSGEVRDD